MSTISKEDYLKTLYHMKLIDNQNVSTAKIAARLEISNAATSEMAKKLDDLGFVNYERYKGVDLTKKGQKYALNIVRRHRLWELFLMNTLGLNWGEVHDEAEKLEHQTSEFLLDKIDEFLGYPEFDPHGDPIPNKNGELPNMPEFIPLSKGRVGAIYRVVKVDHESNQLMQYFSKLGIELNTLIEIVSRLEYDNSVTVTINKQNHTFSEKVAEKLSVVKSN